MKTRKNNTASTRKSSKEQKTLYPQYQLLDDLYFSCVSQKEMDRIRGRGCLGSCGASVRTNKGRIFLILVRRDLDPKIFLEIFYHEFYHYCINKIVLELVDPEAYLPMFSFVTEMLTDEECWYCKRFGTTNCIKHPNSVIQKILMHSIDSSQTNKESSLKIRREFARAAMDCRWVGVFEKDYEYSLSQVLTKFDKRCLRTCL